MLYNAVLPHVSSSVSAYHWWWLSCAEMCNTVCSVK